MFKKWIKYTFRTTGILWFMYAFAVTIFAVTAGVENRLVEKRIPVLLAIIVFEWAGYLIGFIRYLRKDENNDYKM